MKHTLYFILISILFFGCSQEEKQPQEQEPQAPKAKIIFDKLPNTYLVQSDFSSLPNFHDENYDEILDSFVNNCRTTKAKKIYEDLCLDAKNTIDSKNFLVSNFAPYMIHTKDDKNEGLLTGYYEAGLHASLKKSKKYKYPIYETPNDLITVDLSSIYPKLKNYRLRGRIEGQKLVPYYTRSQSSKQNVDANIICYCDSKVDKFFLEIQGSGRVKLDDNSTMFIGYDNQNGHRYRAIGRYLVKINAIKLENVSLQSIKDWLHKNPKRVNEVLNYNKSLVYFKQRNQGATGALGLELDSVRSIAVDRRYIPLGSMVYIDANVSNQKINRIVFAQDTGGAIKGAIRADLFLGSGDEALEVAGHLKSELKLWILLPKTEKKRVI